MAYPSPVSSRMLIEIVGLSRSIGLRWKRLETATVCPWRKHSLVSLGISVEDGELLAGSEITTNESDDGLVYSYWINFEPEAEGELRADLLARFGSLEYELHANFFDDVEHAF